MVKLLLMSGMRVNNGLYSAAASFRGESVGITLTSASDQIVTRIAQGAISVNTNKKLTFIVPAGLAAGEYALKVTTQYSGGGLLKSPRSVERTIWIGTAPTTESPSTDQADTEGGSTDDPYNPFGG